MDTGQPRPPIVLNAMVAAGLVALIALLNAVFNNPIVAIPQAVIAAIAALELKRGDPWAGYGLALYLGCSTLGAAFAAYRVGDLQSPYFLAGAAIPLAAAVLSLLAGQALSARGAQPRSSPLPWIVISAIPLSLSLFLNLLLTPTASMEPTILSGDTLIVRHTGATSVARGDLVVYREPTHQSIFVKRVAGVGGDRIRMEMKTLYVDGCPVNEPYVIHQSTYIDQYRDNFPEGDMGIALSAHMQDQLRSQVHNGDFVVPPGTFFVLGDNRDSSLDSRYTGVIPAASIIGKPWMVCFSTDTSVNSRESGQLSFEVLARARWNRVLKRL